MNKWIKEMYTKYETEVRYLFFGVLTTIISWSAKYLATFVLDATIMWQNSLLSAITWLTGVCTLS